MTNNIYTQLGDRHRAAVILNDGSLKWCRGITEALLYLKDQGYTSAIVHSSSGALEINIQQLLNGVNLTC